MLPTLGSWPLSTRVASDKYNQFVVRILIQTCYKLILFPFF